MTRYGLIGFPLGHSFSRKYFSDKFIREGIVDCSYDLFPIESIDKITGILTGYPDLKGLNVTIPYKKEVLQYLTDTSHLPPGLNACNCIRIDDGKLTGYNTDVAGFELSIRPLLQGHHQHALILGNGGATSAVKLALSNLKIKYAVAGRNSAAGTDLTYDDLNRNIIEKYTVIINTTPLGTEPHTELFPLIPYEYIGHGHLLYDLVYNPPLTTFMKKGTAQGATVKNGYDMLVIQAEESWKIWRA